MIKKNNMWIYAVLTIIGAISIYIGGFVISEKLKGVSGLCIGLGAAIFSIGIGNFIGAFIISKVETEEIIRKKNIEVNDERNIRIREKVGAKINRILIYVLSIIVLVLGFMGVNVVIIIMISSVFLLELILAIVLTNYYSKQM
ncbi:hypothetical protein [Clostridium pasteurianum]|uniref:Uncharacterized protein n=1 Tax=Clostridium pasteurianum BC1 TaxID=86416 RepID=R4K089_CLOPA|nr:hypothetical protein [Clostridium pasteurianum]AGK95978.1 hypothetical protein Clopa_0963 [Clostridium pasteurianum BC1]